MGRLESISSKKSLDWNVEKDGIKEMKSKSESNNYIRDSFDLLFTPEELKTMQASVPIINDDDKALHEDSKGLESEIRDLIAESQFDSKQIGRHTIGEVGIETVIENKESQHRKLDKASIEKQFEIFESNPDIGMVGTNVSEFIDTIENVVCNVILPETNEEIVDFSKKRNPLRHPSVMFKKSEILSAGNYREYYLCEDYDMWLRMIRNGCKCYNIQNIYVYMRIGEDFFKRRGGHKYFKSIKKFKKEQLHNGYFTKVEYLKTIIPHMIVCYMPNSMRDLIYRKLLRKQ